MITYQSLNYASMKGNFMPKITTDEKQKLSEEMFPVIIEEYVSRFMQDKKIDLKCPNCASKDL